jgi:hypothetical protein
MWVGADEGAQGSPNPYQHKMLYNSHYKQLRKKESPTPAFPR